MNNLSSYCGLVDARISTSDKDLPVQTSTNITFHNRKKYIPRLESRPKYLCTRLEKIVET